MSGLQEVRDDGNSSGRDDGIDVSDDQVKDGSVDIQSGKADSFGVFRASFRAASSSVNKGGVESVHVEVVTAEHETFTDGRVSVVHCS